MPFLDDELGLDQLVEVVDAPLAEMVLGDVGDDRDVGAFDAEAAAQHAAAGGLEDRDRQPAGRAAPAARRPGPE